MSYEEEGKKKTGLIVLVVLLLLAIAGGAVAFFLLRKDNGANIIATYTAKSVSVKIEATYQLQWQSSATNLKTKDGRTSIVFSNSTHQFTLGYGKWLWQQAVNGNNGGAKRVGSVARSEKGDTSAKPAASVYPNPTRGHFTLAVSGAGKAGRVSATVYNTQGAVVATFSGSGRESYTFEGDLPSGNIYYATISTDNGSQTIKLVVK